MSTSIEWTATVDPDGKITPGKTWNPTRGCSRVSEGCRNCYAERQAARFAQPALQGMPPDTAAPFHGFVTKVNGHPSWTGKVELIESKLLEPLSWRKPCKVFVNSMSDLFHESLPDEAIDRVFAVMALCPQHTFQILTKRPERMMKWAIGKRGHLACEFQQNPARSASAIMPLTNVWLGVSVESPKHKDRIDVLRAVPAVLRFLSLEPLLEDLGNLDLRGISWVIIGGESGPGARPFNVEWARNTIEQCKATGVAVFYKQGGASNRCAHSRKGGHFQCFPTELQIRDFPSALLGTRQE